MIITLTTDFGQADGYVGAMKGVILSIAPGAQLVDISHEIAPGAVRQAAYVLSTAAPFFPPGTIHLAVVDPGVGGSRRAIAARTPRATFIAPDNGLLSLCLAGRAAEIRRLSNPRYHLPRVSSTFHGRDVFAPAAAHLAAGADFEDLGPPVTDPVSLPPPALARDRDGRWHGEVWHVDRFGNIITTIQLDASDADLQHSLVEIAGRRIDGLARTYVERAPGELMALVGSSGYLEIAIRDGDAAHTLGVQPGDPVTMQTEVCI